jgi:hypothetical protein
MGDTSITFTFTNTNPTSFWEERYELFEQIQKSEKFYKTMNYSERETVVKLVRRALALAMEDVEEWLPDSFTFDGNENTIGIHLNILRSNLEREVSDHMRISEQRVKEIFESIKPEIDQIRGTGNEKQKNDDH